MIGDWWCSVSIVRVQFSSRDTEALSSHKSNCNTVGLSFHTYIGIFVKLFKHTQYISKCRTRIRSLFTHQWLDVTNSTNKKQTKTKKRKKKKESLLMHMDEEIIYHSILRLCLHLYIQQEYVTCYEQRISEQIVSKSIVTNLFFSWK
jgi:hypothetical protein